MKTRFVLFVLLALWTWNCGGESDSQNPEGGEPAADANGSPETAPDPGFNFKWNVPDGFSFVQKEKHAVQTILNPGTEQEEVSKLVVTSSRKFNIGAVDKEGAFAVEMNYLGVMGEFKGDKDKWSYDSNAGKGSKGGNLETLSGQGANFRIDPITGQVLDVSGADAVIAGIAGYDLAPDAANQALREQLQPFWYVLPDGGIPMGGTWTRNYKRRHLFPGNYTSTYTLNKREQGKAEIQFTITVENLNANEAVVVESGKDRYIQELSGSGSGTVTINEASGEFFSHSLMLELEGDRILVDANGQETFRFPMQIGMENVAEYGQK